MTTCATRHCEGGAAITRVSSASTCIHTGRSSERKTASSPITKAYNNLGMDFYNPKLIILGVWSPRFDVGAYIFLDLL